MSPETPSQRQPARWPIFVAIALLVVVAAVFVIEFITASATPDGQITEITADSYMDIVTPFLADADPQNGAALLEQYGCAACHIVGAANNIAPPFEGLTEVAAQRRPPLTAEAYIYESIIYPSVYVVEGYPPSMAQDYRERLTDDELGDIIAYLLRPF